MKRDFTVKSVGTSGEGYQEAVRFIRKYHYSPVMPRINKFVLTFNDGIEILGVLTLGWGTNPNGTVKLISSEHSKEDYLEIGKMCVHPSLNGKHFSSQMISATVRWLKENTTTSFLYTMADGMMGKVGESYQASNFFYGGFFSTKVYMAPNGEKLHVKSCQDQLKMSTIWLRDNYPLDPRVKGIPKNTSDGVKLQKEYLVAAKEDSSIKRKKHWWVSWIPLEWMLESEDGRGWRLLEGRMFRYVLPLNKVAKKCLLKNQSWSFQNGYPKRGDLGFRECFPKVVNGKIKGVWGKIDPPEFNLSADNLRYNKI